ncbi:protein of unknown function [Brochothrix thermosphacta]|nr:protein of unknown function [Brochothrix thermosphacta]
MSDNTNQTLFLCPQTTNYFIPYQVNHSINSRISYLNSKCF